MVDLVDYEASFCLDVADVHREKTSKNASQLFSMCYHIQVWFHPLPHQKTLFSPQLFHLRSSSKVSPCSLASRGQSSPCKCREAATVSRNKHNQNTNFTYFTTWSTHRTQKKETTHPCMRRTSKAHYPQCKIFNVERRISLSVSPSQG